MLSSSRQSLAVESFQMPHECNEICRSVRFVRAQLAKRVEADEIALKLKLSKARIVELAGNYNWDSGSGRKRRICDFEPFDE